MYTWQNPNSMEGELSLLLDNIARATIDVFHSYTGSGKSQCLTTQCITCCTLVPKTYQHLAKFNNLKNVSKQFF